MKHSDVLEIEYKEQSNQYRWIGHMQAIVISLYTAIITLGLAIAVSFWPQDHALIDFHWLAVVIIVMGLTGTVVGYGLLQSRTMQRRTSLYLSKLLLQLAESVDDHYTLSNSALRFRRLCSTGGKFKMWDTMNIAILITIWYG